MHGAARMTASAIVRTINWTINCNSLLQGTSEYNLDWLQRAHNCLARVVLPFSVGANKVRRELLWLPIRQRITFKLATMTYTAKRSQQPAYLSDSLHDYQPTRNLRLAAALLLELQSLLQPWSYY